MRRHERYDAAPAVTVSIELLLDPATEALVREDWRRLETAGHSSLGAYRAESNRPHITLLVRPRLDDVDVRAALDLLPAEIVLGAPIVFDHGERVVLARPVGPREHLERVRRAVRDAAGEGEDAPHTTRDDWTPHVTLARRLRRESVDAACALLHRGAAGAVVGLRRWDSRTRTVTALS